MLVGGSNFSGSNNLAKELLWGFEFRILNSCARAHEYVATDTALTSVMQSFRRADILQEVHGHCYIRRDAYQRHRSRNAGRPSAGEKLEGYCVRGGWPTSWRCHISFLLHASWTATIADIVDLL